MQLLFASKNLNPRQGDQIGRIFAYGAIVQFGQFFCILEVAQIFGLLFSMASVSCDQKRIGLHFGRFISNPSGHPDSCECLPLVIIRNIVLRKQESKQRIKHLLKTCLQASGTDVMIFKIFRRKNWHF
jgi:hypothetical protein